MCTHQIQLVELLIWLYSTPCSTVSNLCVFSRHSRHRSIYNGRKHWQLKVSFLQAFTDEGRRLNDSGLTFFLPSLRFAGLVQLAPSYASVGCPWIQAISDTESRHSLKPQCYWSFRETALSSRGFCLFLLVNFSDEFCPCFPQCWHLFWLSIL